MNTKSDGCVPNNCSTPAIYNGLTKPERHDYKNNSPKVLREKKNSLHCKALLYKVLFTTKQSQYGVYLTDEVSII